MNRSADGAFLRRALEWVMRLPLLGDAELGLLMGMHEVDARYLRDALVRRGWVEWVSPPVDGRAGVPLALVREEALPVLADLVGISPIELAQRVPVRHADVLDRIARTDTVLGVNRLFAELAGAVRREGEAVLDDACSLPVSLPVGERWWPGSVEAYGQLSADGEGAQCFVAWDRAGAPDIHRRRRVRAWFAERRAEGDGLPLILVACAGEREREVWERALLDRLDGEAAPVEVLLATVADLLQFGALDVGWVQPGVEERRALVDWLDWRDVCRAPLRLPERADLPQVERTVPPLRTRLVHRGIPLSEGAPVREQVASLVLALEHQGRVVLEWVARHPWLTTRQLATLLNAPEVSTTRHLAYLGACGTVRSHQIDGLPARLWAATRRGVRLLAAAEQVSAVQYERHGGVAAPQDGDGPPGSPLLPRAFAHELGVSRVVTRLAADARRAGGRLMVWRNEAESTQIFTDRGRRWWIRPDGSGIVEVEGVSAGFLLEYDRGTLKRRDYESKFRAYRHYYAAEAWSERFEAAPLLLVVCADHRAERRVVAATDGGPSDIPMRVMTECSVTSRHASSPQPFQWGTSLAGEYAAGAPSGDWPRQPTPLRGRHG